MLTGVVVLSNTLFLPMEVQLRISNTQGPAEIHDGSGYDNMYFLGDGVNINLRLDYKRNCFFFQIRNIFNSSFLPGIVK